MITKDPGHMEAVAHLVILKSQAHFARRVASSIPTPLASRPPK